MERDFALDREIAAALEARNGHCYEDCLSFFFDGWHWHYGEPRQGPAVWQYVEGFTAIEGGQPVAHAWLERDGRLVIDPTFPAAEVSYFPGRRLGGAELAAAVDLPRWRKGRRLHDFPLIARSFGNGGLEHAGYAAALQRARECCAGGIAYMDCITGAAEHGRA